jgi:hypothetical protein
MIKKSRFSTHHISSGTQIQKIGKPNNLKSLGDLDILETPESYQSNASDTRTTVRPKTTVSRYSSHVEG